MFKREVNELKLLAWAALGATKAEILRWAREESQRTGRDTIKVDPIALAIVANQSAKQAWREAIEETACEKTSAAPLGAPPSSEDIEAPTQRSNNTPAETRSPPYLELNISRHSLRVSGSAEVFVGKQLFEPLRRLARDPGTVIPYERLHCDQLSSGDARFQEERPMRERVRRDKKELLRKVKNKTDADVRAALSKVWKSERNVGFSLELEHQEIVIRE